MVKFSGVVTLSTGEQKDAASFYSERPVAVVFLRHFGCIFCREQVAELKQHPDWNVVFVCQATPDEVAEFKATMKAVHPFLCDPDARIYEDFGLERGALKQLFGPGVWKRGAQAMAKGARPGRTVGDPWRMPGEFIFNTNGVLVWEHRPRHAGDHSSAETLGKALKAVSASSA